MTLWHILHFEVLYDNSPEVVDDTLAVKEHYHVIPGIGPCDNDTSSVEDYYNDTHTVDDCYTDTPK